MKYIFYQGRISLTNVSERKDKMRLGMTLASNPKDNSFVVNIKCYLLKLQLFSVWQYVTDSPDPMGRIIIWLHKMIISLDFHPFFAAQRLLYVVFLNTCVFVLGLWASLVLRMWQLVLQHRHLLQSQCKLQVLQNDSTCLSEYAFECLFSWMKIYELFVMPAGDVFSTCTYCILSGFRITHKCFFQDVRRTWTSSLFWMAQTPSTPGQKCRLFSSTSFRSSMSDQVKYRCVRNEYIQVVGRWLLNAEEWLSVLVEFYFLITDSFCVN